MDPAGSIPVLVIAAEVITNSVYYKYKTVIVSTVYEVEGKNTAFQLMSNFFELL